MAVGVGITTYSGEFGNSWISRKYIYGFTLEYQMKGDFQIITSLLRLDHQPRLPFYLKEVILSKMSEIREAESGIAAEQEGIAYMGEFTSHFDILHQLQFLGG